MHLLLENAMELIPPGRWALGISGGADSVALCHLARQRVGLHLVHLDYELRGQESRGDADSVEQLSRAWQLPLTLRRRSELEAGEALPENAQARYRILRLRLFSQVVREQGLEGVLLAHHADDQAETILLRMIRSAGVQGLAGIPMDSWVEGVRLFRPLLGVPGRLLREYLQENGVEWREDSSNAGDSYLRNRVRQYLRTHAELGQALLAAGEAAASLRKWVADSALPVEESLPLELFELQPRILLRDLLRRWLVSRGAPENDLSVALLDRLLEVAMDAGAPSRMSLPGGLLVGRQRGRLVVR